MERRLDLAAACAFVVAAVFSSAWMPGQFTSEGLDRLHGFVSRLAARDQEWSVLFRFCDTVAGLTCLAGVALVVRVREEWQGWLAMALFGLCTAVGGLFPLDCAGCGGALSFAHQAHVAAGVAATAAVLVAMVLLSARWRSPLAWLVTAATYAATMATLVADAVGRYAGLAQRLQVTLIAIWLLYLATRLLVEATPALESGPFHVVSEGAGRPVLLSSGPAGAWFHWDAVAETLRHGHRVIRFDRPGLGLSPAVTTPPTLYGEAARLAALVPGSERATVVARSVAAWHAEAFARLHPLRVARLVLIDPACGAGPGTAWAAGLRRWAPALGATWGAAAVARALGPLAHRLRTGMVDPHGVYRTGRVAAAAVGEWLARGEMAADLEEVRREHPFPAVPVTVISTGGAGECRARLAADLGARLVGVADEGERRAAVVEACQEPRVPGLPDVTGVTERDGGDRM
ncbi:DUF998 domain-containing protein [Nonomuraea africana]|uniref:Pimeloyl-ACP methyl ester carboxylesterase n=1 Tax=Nonomuraea africana TaxID=46171 RepID=A0ABR9KHZ6_9ACTN|nr:DUF998 domain-containing protein [Nonomuraea africana]MBE1561633.1 pimeloyl-ACP methyl ester carboxylesterase [Nonomuraea africana]